MLKLQVDRLPGRLDYTCANDNHAYNITDSIHFLYKKHSQIDVETDHMLEIEDTNEILQLVHEIRTVM